MTNTKANIAAAFKLVRGFDGSIINLVKREANYQVGQIVSFLIPGLMMDAIPAIIHQRHENKKGDRYDLIIHYPTISGWTETRVYSIDELFLSSVVGTYEDITEEVAN